MDSVALRPLTVDFHETSLIATLNGEGANADKLYWGGPVNPQALNRYSYVMNNPLRWTDPTGHSWYLNATDAGHLADELDHLADQTDLNIVELGIAEGTFALVFNTAANAGVEGAAILLANPFVLFAAAAGTLFIGGALASAAASIRELAHTIRSQIDPDYGVAITTQDGVLYAMNRRTGGFKSYNIPIWLQGQLPSTLQSGQIHGNFDLPGVTDERYFRRDCPKSTKKCG